MPPGLLHLVCGSTGAGKTTYAIALAQRSGAIQFSIDEWMTALFWMDSPQPIDPSWSIDRVARCTALIGRTAFAVAHRGTPCVLEIGLTTRAARMEIAASARANGLPIKLHFLDVAADERWRRVEARNRAATADAQLAFPITRELFDFVERMWEPPDAEELAALDGVRTAG